MTDIRRVTVDDYGNATITTELTGELVAWYPARAVTYDDYTGGYNILNTPVQTGMFADANICSAAIDETAKKATFENKYALLIVTPPDGAQSLTIRSLKVIEESSRQRTGKSAPINVSTVTDSAYFVTVPTPPKDEGKYYVALREKVYMSNLSFEVEFEKEGTGSIKGIPLSRIEENAAALGESANRYNFIDEGTAYTIDDKNWHEYVEVGGKRWATMNLGANTVADSYETCCGDYYAWGETEPYYDSRVWAETPKTWNITKWKEGKEGGYCWQSYCKKDSFEEWIPAPYDNTSKILTSVYDVVQKKVGGGWRMPTSAEFVALANACIGDCNMDDEGEITPAVLANPSEKDPVDQGIYWCSNYEGAAGLLFVDAKGVELFFPAMGFYIKQEIGYLGYNIGVSGCYLASDLAEDYCAFSMFFTNMEFTVEDSGDRCFGCCIRPVSGELAEPADEEESPATEMTEEVLF